MFTDSRTEPAAAFEPLESTGAVFTALTVTVQSSPVISEPSGAGLSRVVPSSASEEFSSLEAGLSPDFGALTEVLVVSSMASSTALTKTALMRMAKITQLSESLTIR